MIPIEVTYTAGSDGKPRASGDDPGPSVRIDDTDE